MEGCSTKRLVCTASCEAAPDPSAAYSSLSASSNMGHFFLSIVALLVVASQLVVAGCHSTMKSEDYWRSMLPSTPIPMAIRGHFSSDPAYGARGGGDAIITGPGGNPVTIHRDVRKAAARINLYPKNVDSHHSELATNMDLGRSNARVDESNVCINRPGAPFFFLEKDLHVGAKVEMMFKRPLHGDHFLPPGLAAGTIPFFYRKLPDSNLDRFSLPSDSAEARETKRMHYFCEQLSALGKTMLCATSLESMAHFIASSLGGGAPNMNIRPLSSTTEKETASLQLHTVVSITPVPTEADTIVACHLMYPHAAYLCHKGHRSKPYVIKLVSQSDGNMVEAAATCHGDTADVDPNYYALKALGVKPGEASVCHFFAVSDFAFVPITTPTNDAAQ